MSIYEDGLETNINRIACKLAFQTHSDTESIVQPIFLTMSFQQTPRKKRKVLTIEDKLKVCDMVKQNVSKKIIMDKFDITRRTITGITSKEAQLLEFKSGKTERGISTVLKET